MQRPNLSNLTHGCRPCHPQSIGETFEDYDSALGSAPSWAEPRLDPDGVCAICLGRLDRESQNTVANPSYSLQNTSQVEGLFEYSNCGHCFHRTCLEMAMLSGTRACPLCRTPIARSVLSTVFSDAQLDAEGITDAIPLATPTALIHQSRLPLPLCASRSWRSRDSAAQI